MINFVCKIVFPSCLAYIMRLLCTIEMRKKNINLLLPLSICSSFILIIQFNNKKMWKCYIEKEILPVFHQRTRMKIEWWMQFSYRKRHKCSFWVWKIFWQILIPEIIKLWNHEWWKLKTRHWVVYGSISLFLTWMMFLDGFVLKFQDLLIDLKCELTVDVCICRVTKGSVDYNIFIWRLLKN